MTQEFENQYDRNRSTKIQSAPPTWWCGCIIGINEKEYFTATDNMTLSRGDNVIITTRYGMDMARICGTVRDLESIDATQVRRIIRIANDSDHKQREKLNEKEKESAKICRSYIDDNRLKLNLVKVHYMLNEERLLMFYTAEKRIDFRILIKDLANILMIRIEMRHIGNREESRIHGGVGVCGRMYCCHGTMNRLEPVSIKMAKDQNLTLNTQKITGGCGRLLCCLAYEQRYYTDIRRKLPEEGTIVEKEDSQYRVCDINVMLGTVLLSSREGERLQIDSSQLVQSTKGVWRVKPESELTGHH